MIPLDVYLASSSIVQPSSVTAVLAIVPIAPSMGVLTVTLMPALLALLSIQAPCNVIQFAPHFAKGVRQMDLGSVMLTNVIQGIGGIRLLKLACNVINHALIVLVQLP